MKGNLARQIYVYWYAEGRVTVTRTIGGKAILCWAFFAMTAMSNLNVGCNAGDINPVPNFGEVTPRLYRGSVPDQSGLQYLARHQFNTVIDFRLRHSKKEQRDCARLKMRYIWLPLTPIMAPSKEAIDKFLAIVSNPRSGKIYLHCLAGGDRTGMMVALYRVMVQNWDYNKAQSEMQRYHYRPWLSTFLQTVWAYSQARKDSLSRRVVSSAPR